MNVRRGNGVKVHVPVVFGGKVCATRCAVDTINLNYSNIFRVTTDAVDCKTCLRAAGSWLATTPAPPVVVPETCLTHHQGVYGVRETKRGTVTTFSCGCKVVA